MQIYRGARRLFETILEEDITSSSTVRVIKIPGVTMLEEVLGCIITVKSIIVSEPGDSYIKINDLDLVPLKIFYNKATPASPNHAWVQKGQVYSLVYTGEYFTLIGANDNNIKTSYSFNFLNDNPTQGLDISTYLSVSDFNSIKVDDNIMVYYNAKASNINSNILSMLEWTNTYDTGKSCTVKTIAFLDYSCNPVSIDICKGTDNKVYYGNIPGYDVV